MRSKEAEKLKTMSNACEIPVTQLVLQNTNPKIKIRNNKQISHLHIKKDEGEKSASVAGSGREQISDATEMLSRRQIVYSSPRLLFTMS